MTTQTPATAEIQNWLWLRKENAESCRGRLCWEGRVHCIPRLPRKDGNSASNSQIFKFYLQDYVFGAHDFCRTISKVSLLQFLNHHMRQTKPKLYSVARYYTRKFQFTVWTARSRLQQALNKEQHFVTQRALSRKQQLQFHALTSAWKINNRFDNKRKATRENKGTP